MYVRYGQIKDHKISFVDKRLSPQWILF